MDLHLAKASHGTASRTAAIATALCFVLAGALLVVSLASPKSVRSDPRTGQSEISLLSNRG